MNDIQSIISQLERQRDAIERALGALRDIEGTGTPAAKKQGAAPGKKRGRKRRISAEGRARIAAATRKRWADKRAAEAATAAKKSSKKRANKIAVVGE